MNARKDKKRPPLEAEDLVAVEKSCELFLEQNRLVSQEVCAIFKEPKYQRIAIFGASATATFISHLVGADAARKIRYVIDNDSGKHGKFIDGVDAAIMAPQSMPPDGLDVVIISTSLYYDEAYAQLTGLGVDKARITRNIFAKTGR
jgi:hypothetical protein